jgi:P4 family phage/plasmid primase-like protien
MDEVIVKTDKEEFSKFHKLLIQNAPDSYVPFYFKCAELSKNPHLPAGKWLNAGLTYDNAVKWMSEGGNIGIAGLTNDRLVIVDIDDPSVTDYQAVKHTLTAQSGSRTGYHLFYFESMNGEIPNIPTDEAGEIRANNQYVIAPGSYVSGYKGDLENIGKYTIKKAIGAVKISLSEIPQVFINQLAKVKQDAQTVINRKAKAYSENPDASAFFGLSVYDILNEVQDPQKRFPSIFHSSKTGENTSISTKGLIQCWRHGVSLNAQQALCVLSGFLTCQEAGESHAGAGAGSSLYSGNDEALFYAWKYARENNYVSDSDSIPRRVLRHIALEQKFCTEAEIEDGWKIPKEALRKTNEYLEVVGLKTHSIALPLNRTKKTSQNKNTEVKEDSIMQIQKKDIWTTNENGKIIIDLEKLTFFIEESDNYLCITDTQELLVYRDGIYIEEKNYLDRFLQDCLFSEATIRFKAEIRKQIKDRNPIERREINKDKTRILVKNGILNLDTHLLESFSKDRIYTSGLPVTYNPEVSAPEFLRFISEILPLEEEPVIQEMFGFCLWQAYPSAKSFWLIGEGGNGKSVLTSVLAALLNGVKNVSHVPLNEMSGTYRFAGYELYGKFANIIPEPSTTRALETPFLKAITGESPISVEKKGVQKRVHFVNFAKIIIEANNIPRIADEKQALWDRIIAIEFPYSFRGRENENPEILKTLITQDSLSGVLNWALIGLARLRANNWHFTGSVCQENMKTSMQIKSNPVAAFKDSWLSFSRRAETLAQAVYDAYNLFGVLNGAEPLFKAALSKELEEDNRIALHRVRRDRSRPYVFRGCELSSKIICAYGWYDDRPLKLGEFDELKEDTDVEIRTCSLGDYCLEYPEPVEEVQEIVGEKLIIFNTPGLSELYKRQLKAGTVKHLGPLEIIYENDKGPVSNENASNEKKIPLFIKPISPLVEATCERCRKQAFLGYELTDEESVKSLVCSQCNKEIEEEIGKLKPPVFNTTLEERRAKIKGEEKE